MVAIFTGAGAGFERGSRAAIGAAGLLGSAALGRNGEGVFLNAASGNLLITQQDEYLVGRGPDTAVSRTYNSLGALDDNGDYWRQSTDRRVFGLVGTANADGSTVKRVSADGSEILYEWNGDEYRATSDNGATDTLTYSSGSSSWTWRDGDSQLTETYAASGTDNWRITQQTDSDGNSLTFTYTGDKLTRVATQDGGYTDYVWTGTNITSVVTGYTDLATSTSATLTRTRYAYDSSNRLVQVTTDLSPNDNSVSDGNIYTTTYTYQGSTNLVASISETDGSRLDITYDGQGRVSQWDQTAASGDVRTTTVDYLAGRTEVTDPSGQVTALYYNWGGQLTKVVSPPAVTGGDPQVVQFDYMAGGDFFGSDPSILHSGNPAWGGTQVDWTIATGPVDGIEAVSVSKPWAYAQPWDGWTVPGSIRLMGGDRIDGSYSVTAGETIGYSFASHKLEGAAYVVSVISFVDSDGNLISTSDWLYNNDSGWSLNQDIAVAPTGAVAAYVEVSPMDWGVPSETPMGFAFYGLEVQHLPTGATEMKPYAPNLMHGGDLSLGASIISDGDDAAGGTETDWSLATAIVDGQPAITFEKPYGFLGGDSWNNPGSVKLAGGDRVDGSFSVTPGQIVGYRFNAHTLGGATDIISAFVFYDASGNEIGRDGWLYNGDAGWTTNLKAAWVPAGAVSAVVEVWPAGWEVPSSTAMGAAVNNLSFYSAVAGATILPDWTASLGRLKSITDATGAQTTYSYDANGNIASITDANGDMTRRLYDANNNLIEERRSGSYLNGLESAGSVYTRNVYDSENHLRYSISAQGDVAEFRYTTAGQLEYTVQYTQQTYPQGDTNPTLTAMDSWRDGLSDRSEAKTSKIVYDDRGNVKETLSWSEANASGVPIDADGYSDVVLTYDQAGHLLSRHVVGQSSETFVYDGLGRVTLSTDLAGGTTTIAFLDAAMQTTVTTAAGYVTTSTYDRAGELVSRADSGSFTTGGTETFAYNKNGQIGKITDATGNVSYALYDKTGRKTADIGNSGEVTEYRYDQDGRVTASVRYTNTLTSTQISSISDPNSGVEIASVRPSADARDIWQWSVYDAGGRVIETIDGEGSATRYQYDQFDRLTATTSYFNKVSSTPLAGFKTAAPTALTLPTSDARDVVMRTFYDSDGRVIGALNGEGGLSRIIYDAAGQKVQAIAYARLTAPGLHASGTFDELFASTSADAAHDISTRYVYDGQGLLRFTIDPLNHVTEFVYAAGTVSAAVGLVRKAIAYAGSLATLGSYDFNTVASAVSSLASNANNRIGYSVYNGAAELVYSIDPMGAVTAFSYDGSGRVTKTVQFADAVDMTTMGTDASWKANLDTWASSHATGERVTRTYYSARGEVRFTIDAENYVTQNDYDAEGRLYTQHRYASQVASTDAWTTSTVDGASKGASIDTQYRYDGLGRLSDVYDGAGTRTTTLYYANGAKSYAIVANGQGADESRTLYRYDAAGKVTQTVAAADSADAVTTSYQYDGLGNLTSTTDASGATTSFTYDKAGRVLTQTNDLSGVTHFAYDVFGRTVATVDARGNGAYSYYDQDSRVTTSLDAAGQVTQTAYTAFGEIASVKHFAGHYQPYQNTFAAGGTGYAIGLESIDGELSMTARNQVGELPSWSWAPVGGLVEIDGGDRSDGQVTVAGGDTLSFSLDVKALSAGATVQANVAYTYSGGGTGQDGWSSTVSDDWTTIGGTLTVPAGVVAVHIEVLSYRADANASGGFDFAVRGIQLTRNSVALDVMKPAVGSSTGDATTSFQYDKLGRLTQTTDAAGATEVYTLDAFGQRTSVQNKLGGVTISTYDKRGLLTSEELPVGAYRSDGTLEAAHIVNTYSYDERGNRTQMVEAYGLDEQRTTNYFYDANNRLITKSGDSVLVAASSTSAATSATPTEHYIYDLRGDLIESVDAAGARTLRWYDKLGRPTHTLSAVGTLTRNFYDANGNVTETRVYATAVTLPTDATGTPPAGSGDYRTTLFTYDALNRLTDVSTPSVLTATYATSLVVTTQTTTTHYEYDAVGNVVRVTDPKGGQTYTYYDALNRKTAQIDAGNYRTDWTYDSNGNVLTERRYSLPSATPTSTTTPPALPGSAPYYYEPDDRVTAFTYDLMGRRLTETRPDVWVDDGAYWMTRASSVVQYTYNALGEVVRKTEATGEYAESTYDVGGRMISEQRSAFTDFNVESVTPTVNYSYDGLNNVARIGQPGATGTSARVTTYVHDHAGRVSSMTDPEGFTHYYAYDAAGRVVRETFGSLTTTGYTYDLAGRVTIQNTLVQTGGVWAEDGQNHTNTSYDAFGDVIARGANDVLAEHFSYDSAGRLWQTNTGDGTWKYFMYDANGNQTVMMESSGTDISAQSLAYVRGLWGATAMETGYVAGVVATITSYNARNQAVSVLEPQRDQDGTGVHHDLVTTREYNAFGEVTGEVDAAGNRIDYAYNNMGRLLSTQSPAVSITHEDGSTESVRPIEYNGYDASGRLVWTKNANGNMTRLTLLSGTGYNGSQASVLSSRTDDGAVTETRYDVFGDARVSLDQLAPGDWGHPDAHKTTMTYDNMGRLIQSSDPAGLVETYAYNGLGQRTLHYNSLLGIGNAEQTTYDAEGRVVVQVAMGGDTTSFAYAWNAGITIGGLGVLGGWTKTTTWANWLTSSEQTDVFGRTISKTDMSSEVSNSTYDAAGRLSRRTGGTAVNYAYFNTGRLSSVETDQAYATSNQERARLYLEWNPDVAAVARTSYTALSAYVTGGDFDGDGDNDIYDYALWHASIYAVGDGRTLPADIWTQKHTTYSYDKVGNLLTEKLVEENHGDVLENAQATYDALGRLKTWSQAAGSPTAPDSSTSYEYDAAGNIRRTVAQFHPLDAEGVASSGTVTQDYWYRYDALNRVVTDKGQLVSSAIVRGDKGTDITYDLKGQRMTAQSTLSRTIDLGDPGLPIYVTYDATHREDYAYDAGGRLTQVYVGENGYLEAAPTGPGTLRSNFQYDSMGRQTEQLDYDPHAPIPGSASFSRATVYNAKSQIVTDSTASQQSTETDYADSTYDYGTGLGYALGSVLSITTINHRNVLTTAGLKPATKVENGYVFHDGAEQFSVAYTPDNTSHPTVKQTSSYLYDRVGGQEQLSSVAIQDGRKRNVMFTNDLNGQVIRRDEGDNLFTAGDPHEVWYRFGGRQMGYDGNNGTLETDYETSVATHHADPGGSGAFRNGATFGGALADFAQGISPLTAYNQGSSAGSYTVQAGESLSSIAANLWGDASLWYKLAEANGLSGQSGLIEGQALRVPAGVMSSAHNASTLRPYDPAATMGDTAPTNPIQPKPGKHGCGVLGTVILVVIAVVVSYFTAGAAAGAFASAFAGGGAAGAAAATSVGAVLAGTASVSTLSGAALGGLIAGGVVGGVAGSIASQAVGVTTGIQDKFSWNAVAMAGIGGGVGAGLGVSGFGGGGWEGAALRGAAGSAITQGIGVATGLQSKFSWAGVAAAGIGAGVGAFVGHQIGAASLFADQTAENIGRNAVQITANTIANAATRSLIDGSDFGDNIRASLPEIIGQTIGEAIVGKLVNSDAPSGTIKRQGQVREAQVGDAPIPSFKRGDGEYVAATNETVDLGKLQGKDKFYIDPNKLPELSDPGDKREVYIYKFDRGSSIGIVINGGEPTYYDPVLFDLPSKVVQSETTGGPSPSVLGALGGGAAAGLDKMTKGTPLWLNGRDWNFALTRPEGSYLPTGGSSSRVFINKPELPNKMLRLDYGYNVQTKSTNWHWNQEGVAKDFGITNHSVTGAAETGALLNKLQGASRVLVFTGVVASGYEIATSKNPIYETGRQASGWAGALTVGEAGAESGAFFGGAIGSVFGGVGAVPGALIGGTIGGLIGGVAGWIGGTSIYEGLVPVPGANR